MQTDFHCVSGRLLPKSTMPLPSEPTFYTLVEVDHQSYFIGCTVYTKVVNGNMESQFMFSTIPITASHIPSIGMTVVMVSTSYTDQVCSTHSMLWGSLCVAPNEHHRTDDPITIHVSLFDKVVVNAYLRVHYKVPPTITATVFKDRDGMVVDLNASDFDNALVHMLCTFNGAIHTSLPLSSMLSRYYMIGHEFNPDVNETTPHGWYEFTITAHTFEGTSQTTLLYNFDATPNLLSVPRLYLHQAAENDHIKLRLTGEIEPGLYDQLQLVLVCTTDAGTFTKTVPWVAPVVLSDGSGSWLEGSGWSYWNTAVNLPAMMVASPTVLQPMLAHSTLTVYTTGLWLQQRSFSHPLQLTVEFADQDVLSLRSHTPRMVTGESMNTILSGSYIDKSAWVALDGGSGVMVNQSVVSGYTYNNYTRVTVQSFDEHTIQVRFTLQLEELTAVIYSQPVQMHPHDVAEGIVRPVIMSAVYVYDNSNDPTHLRVTTSWFDTSVVTATIVSAGEEWIPVATAYETTVVLNSQLIDWPSSQTVVFEVHLSKVVRGGVLTATSQGFVNRLNQPTISIPGRPAPRYNNGIIIMGMDGIQVVSMEVAKVQLRIRWVPTKSYVASSVFYVKDVTYERTYTTNLGAPQSYPYQGLKAGQACTLLLTAYTSSVPLSSALNIPACNAVYNTVVIEHTPYFPLTASIYSLHPSLNQMGRIKVVIQPSNGIVFTLEYHPRAYLTSENGVSVECTQYAFKNNGNIITWTLNVPNTIHSSVNTLSIVMIRYFGSYAMPTVTISTAIPWTPLPTITYSRPFIAQLTSAGLTFRDNIFGVLYGADSNLRYAVTVGTEPVKYTSTLTTISTATYPVGTIVPVRIQVYSTQWSSPSFNSQCALTNVTATATYTHQQLSFSPRVQLNQLRYHVEVDIDESVENMRSDNATLTATTLVWDVAPSPLPVVLSITYDLYTEFDGVVAFSRTVSDSFTVTCNGPPFMVGKDIFLNGNDIDTVAILQPTPMLLTAHGRDLAGDVLTPFLTVDLDTQLVHVQSENYIVALDTVAGSVLSLNGMSVSQVSMLTQRTNVTFPQAQVVHDANTTITVALGQGELVYVSMIAGAVVEMMIPMPWDGHIMHTLHFVFQGGLVHIPSQCVSVRGFLVESVEYVAYHFDISSPTILENGAQVVTFAHDDHYKPTMYEWPAIKVMHALHIEQQSVTLTAAP